MIYNSLLVPPRLRGGIRPLIRGAAGRKFIYGVDTETHNGPPTHIQIFSEQAARADIIDIADPQKALRTFLRYCRSLIPQAQHVFYGHNLDFDLTSLCWEQKHQLVGTASGEFEFSYDGWHLKGVYGAPTFVTITDESRNRTIKLVDSFRYYPKNLAAAAAVFCPHLPKLAMPEGLGQKRFSSTDPVFRAYAMRDSEIAYHIGVALEAMHDEFDLPQTVSVADMAAKIFRHSYLERPIPHPRRDLMLASLSAYHGGKNNTTVGTGWYPRVYSLDISSAYPDAMASFPSFYEANLYKPFRATQPRSVPELGVYRVWGYIKPDPWPVLFAHNFAPIGKDGHGKRVEGLCVTGFELNEAIRSKELTPTLVDGWFYDAEKDRNEPPMRRFVEEFYARKESETDPGRRAMQKLILNALYGKYIQTRKRNKIENYDFGTDHFTGAGDLVAGGMFHPFIAALITGHTRARIHRLEHQYRAIHTATDGIFTEQNLAGVDLGAKGLGALVNEAEGELLLLRNKLYILYGDGPFTGEKGTYPSVLRPEKHIIKYATHGFQGRSPSPSAALEQLVLTGERYYTINKPNRLRSSLQRGETPNDFAERRLYLNIGEIPVHKPAPVRDNTGVSTRKRRA
jgi:hypothetical protein